MNKEQVDEFFGLKDAVYWVQEASATPQFIYPVAIGTVNELSKHLQNVFLMDKGWNQNIILKSNVIRVNDLKTITKFIENTL